MPETNFANSTTSQLNSGVPNYQVPAKVVDEAGAQPETYWLNPYWPTYLGYLKTIPEYKNAVRALSIWAFGRGWSTDFGNDKIILEHLAGWGEDTFDSIIQDMLVVKKTNGDAYAEIIRGDNGTLVNLKKLNPSKVRHVVNPKGLLIGYDVMQADGKYQRFKVEDIFHVSNDRIANEIHGTSVLESCKWVIDAYNEAMADIRRVMHRSMIRVIYVDADDTTKLTTIRNQWKTAIKDGEVLILPGKRGQDFEVVDYSVPPVTAYLAWIEYLNNFFYEILGVPKITTGGTMSFTEASAKVGYLTFEVPYMTEQRLMEQDLWNQLGIRITFERPASLMPNVQSDQAANTGQMGFQPSSSQMPMMNNKNVPAGQGK